MIGQESSSSTGGGGQHETGGQNNQNVQQGGKNLKRNKKLASKATGGYSYSEHYDPDVEKLLQFITSSSSTNPTTSSASGPSNKVKNKVTSIKCLSVFENSERYTEKLR